MDIVKIADMVIKLALIVTMIYFVAVANDFKVKFMECQQKQLCIEGLLKGTVCDKYDLKPYFMPDFSTPATGTTLPD